MHAGRYLARMHGREWCAPSPLYFCHVTDQITINNTVSPQPPPPLIHIVAFNERSLASPRSSEPSFSRWERPDQGISWQGTLFHCHGACQWREAHPKRVVLPCCDHSSSPTVLFHRKRPPMGSIWQVQCIFATGITGWFSQQACYSSKTRPLELRRVTWAPIKSTGQSECCKTSSFGDCAALRPSDWFQSHFSYNYFLWRL